MITKVSLWVFVCSTGRIISNEGIWKKVLEMKIKAHQEMSLKEEKLIAEVVWRSSLMASRTIALVVFEDAETTCM